MGKKKKGAVCNNPVAMARAAGPAPITGPTIRDYLNRDRPSLEEAAGIIAAQYSKKECGSLAAYEGQIMNENYRKELKKRREQLLSAASAKSSHKSRSRDEKEKKKKKKHKKEKKVKKEKTRRDRSRSRSRSPSPTSSSEEDFHVSRKHRHRSPVRSGVEKSSQSSSSVPTTSLENAASSQTSPS